MKKHFGFLALSLFSLALIVLSCKGGGSGEAYTLKMRLAKSDSFGQAIDMTMDMNMKIAGQTMNMGMGINGTTAFHVLDTTPDSKDLAMTYKDLKMSMKMNGQEMSDQTNPVGNRIIGKTVNIKLNGKNQITDVTGFDEAFATDSQELDSATRAQIKNMFSKEQMNSLFGMMFQVYPDKPVRVGDTWKSSSEINIGGVKMNVDGDYKLVSVSNGVASISLDGKIKGKGTMAQAGTSIDMDMDGGQKGIIDINIADGYLKNSQLKMDIDAKMEVMGQHMDMTMKGDYTAKGTN